MIRWIDALTGQQVGIRTEQQSSGNTSRQASDYGFDDGYVRYTVFESSSSGSSSGGGYGSTFGSVSSTSTTTGQATTSFVPVPGSGIAEAQFSLRSHEFFGVSSSSQLLDDNAPDGILDTSSSFSRTTSSSRSVAFSVDINENGLVSYVLRETTESSSESGRSRHGHVISQSGSAGTTFTALSSLVVDGRPEGVQASSRSSRVRKLHEHDLRWLSDPHRRSPERHGDWRHRRPRCDAVRLCHLRSGAVGRIETSPAGVSQCRRGQRDVPAPGQLCNRAARHG